jgi:peptidoglycan/xylan/chitin deacetylase (PgdA/CDA1 family)
MVVFHADLAARNLRGDERSFDPLESGGQALKRMWLEGGIGACAAGGGAAWAVRGRSSQVFGESVWRGNSGRARIALTFDDGPSEWTCRVLDVLEENGAKGTFFQVGVNALAHRRTAREVSMRGHEIGNHTQTHARLFLRSAGFVREEIRLAQAALAEVHGKAPRWFRATYGCRWFGVNQAQKELGLTGAMWTAIALDWKMEEDAISRRLAAAARNGAIFCLHDGRVGRANPDAGPTVGALRKLLPELKRRGYELVTLSEVLE